MKQYTMTVYENEDYDKISTEMTNEEVVELLLYIKRGYIPDYNYTGSEEDFENYKLNMAMSKAILIIKSLALGGIYG